MFPFFAFRYPVSANFPLSAEKGRFRPPSVMMVTMMMMGGRVDWRWEGEACVSAFRVARYCYSCGCGDGDGAGDGGGCGNGVDGGLVGRTGDEMI